MRNRDISEAIRSFGIDPSPAEALANKYGGSRAATIIKELVENGYDIVAEEAKSHPSGTIFVFPRTESMSDTHWYRVEFFTIIAFSALWLVVDWSLSCRLASAIEDAIIVLGIGVLFFYRNGTALLLTTASAGALFLCAYWLGGPTHAQDRRVSVPAKNVRPYSAPQHNSQPRTKWL
jgi:hypothetical protein